MSTADKQAALKEATEMLENGVKSVFTSERYIEFLSFMSKFHNYSYNNCILIMMQNPEASLVAGFNDWKNKHNRYVKKGEKGIKIIAPAPYKTTVKVPVLDANNQPVMVNGEPLTENKVVQKMSFRVVSVFDVSQTDGEPLPSIAPELTANVDNFEELFQAICATTDYTVNFADIPGTAKGFCRYSDKTITIRKGMSEAQIIKTAIHEAAHSRLHKPSERDSNTPLPTRSTKEVEAESVAFLISRYFGVDTSDYSFDYVANWSTDKEIAELKQSLEVIQSEASAMIDIIEEKYAEIMKSKATVIEESIDTVSVDIDDIQKQETEYGVEVKSRQASFVNPNKEPITSQNLAEFISSHKEFIANTPNKHNTIVINAFAGPGAGKTTSCLEICAELKKAGYVAEYVQEYAKELVWEGKLDMLSGSTEGQFHILKEQLCRMDRLYGKVDFIVTDCPVLLPAIYLKEPNPEFEVASKEIFEHFRNFNYFVERDASSFETKGRIHNLEESLKIDETLKSTLSSYGLYYGFYNHSTINKIVTNSIRYRENSFTTAPDKGQPSLSNIDIASKVREIPIVDYAARMGFTVQKVGTYYTLKEHDSVRIDPRTNRFFRNSTGDKGSIIDFVMEFENVDNKTAISQLARYLGTDRPVTTRSQSSKPKEKASELVLPEKSKSMRNIFAYLIQTRKIHPEIVNEWVSKKNLYQDTHNNCVFVTYDNKGNPAFVSQRGTNTSKPFKADVPGSNYDICHFINNGASKLIVCEGVIDLMSLQTIFKAHGRDLSSYNYLSLNGSTKINAIINALQSSQTDMVVLATDNDTAGRLARDTLRDLISEYDSGIKVEDYVPPHEKDWNAELVAKVLTEEQKKTSEQPSLADKVSSGQSRASRQVTDKQKATHNKNKNEPNL